MPTPKKLENVGQHIFDLIEVATQEPFTKHFQEAEFGQMTSLCLQVRNALKLLQTVTPDKCPEHLHQLRGKAAFMAVQLNKTTLQFTIGPSNQVGQGALVAKMLAEAGKAPTPGAMASPKVLRTVSALQSGLLDDLPPFNPESAKELGHSPQTVATATAAPETIPERSQQELLDVLTGKKEL